MGHAVTVNGHTAGEIDGVEISGFKLDSGNGMGFIALSGTVDVAPTAENLVLDDISVDGVQIGLMGVGTAELNDVTVRNVTGAGSSGAVELTGVDDLTIESSTFTGNDRAIRLQETSDIEPFDAYGENGPVTITGSTFTSNTVAVDNGDDGVTIIAERNWWGAASRPTNVVGDVDVNPWCMNGACTSFSNSARRPVYPPVTPDAPPAPPVIVPPKPTTPPKPITPPGQTITQPHGRGNAFVGGQPAQTNTQQVPPPPPTQRTEQDKQPIRESANQVVTTSPAWCLGRAAAGDGAGHR